MCLTPSAAMPVDRDRHLTEAAITRLVKVKILKLALFLWTKLDIEVQ